MNPRITIFLCIVFLLTGCSEPTANHQTQQPSPPPTATFPLVPSRVVTLSNETPLPTTIRPSLGVTEPTGPMVTLKGDGFVNLRSGPSPLNPIVGRAASGATFVALAQSEHGDWLLLSFPDTPGGKAWVYTAYTDYQPALHPLPVAAPAQPGAPAQAQTTLTPGIATRCNLAGVIENIQLALALPRHPLTFVETSRMINSPTGNLDVTICQDTEGRKFSVDLMSKRVVEIDARSLLPGIPTNAPSMTEAELHSKAIQYFQAMVPNAVALQASLTYEAGGKVDNYFYTWRGPLKPGLMNAPFVQIGLHKSGLLFAYYNTLQVNQ